jgi:hypothetical protein
MRTWKVSANGWDHEDRNEYSCSLKVGDFTTSLANDILQRRIKIHWNFLTGEAIIVFQN